MKKFNKCLFCGKPIRKFRSRRTKFCNRSHYFLFVEIAKIRFQAKNEISEIIRREKQPVAAS